MLRRVAAAQWRGLLMLAVAMKLLVPVGYMPAAFADGGPVRLCDTGLPTAFLATLESRAAGASAGHHEDASHHQGGDHDEDGNHHESSSHHEWEKCSLGGLAGLAAIATEWRFDAVAAAPGRILADDSALLPRSVIPAFRSRAPPLAIS